MAEQDAPELQDERDGKRERKRQPLPPPHPDGLAELTEAQAFLRVSRATLYGMMDRGELAWVKLGRARRVKWSDLRALVSANTRGGTAP